MHHGHGAPPWKGPDGPFASPHSELKYLLFGTCLRVHLETSCSFLAVLAKTARSLATTLRGLVTEASQEVIRQLGPSLYPASGGRRTGLLPNLLLLVFIGSRLCTSESNESLANCVASLLHYFLLEQTSGGSATLWGRPHSLPKSEDLANITRPCSRSFGLLEPSLPRCSPVGEQCPEGYVE